MGTLQLHQVVKQAFLQVLEDLTLTHIDQMNFLLTIGYMMVWSSMDKVVPFCHPLQRHGLLMVQVKNTHLLFVQALNFMMVLFGTVPLQISGWTCNGNTFEITTTDKYYPLLQELTYIRPLRMLSPTKFVGGYNNNPLTENSCHVGWGSATHEGVTVNCAGITGISGTGRWKYVTTIFNEFGNVTNEVLFERNTDHWDPVPNNAAKFMRLIRYDDHAAVTAALKSGTLDLVVGADVLTPKDITMFQDHTSMHQVYLTEPLQNRIIIINTARAPTDDIKVRKVMIHAVNKATIVEKELGVLGRPVNGLFPITAPYCDVDLTPTWDYDLEKAELLNCPNNSDPVTPVTESTESKKKSSPDNIGIIVFLIILVVVALIGIACMIKREKAGRPIFKPLIEIDNIKTEGTVNN